ncbi:MAG: hypothetical protein AB7F09_17820 [Parvibaculaceae bacterium]
MTVRNRAIRLQIMLDDDEVAAIEDWRFRKRMPSRASAVREIIRRGLAAEGFTLANVGQKSSDYGVVATPRSTEKPPDKNSR